MKTFFSMLITSLSLTLVCSSAFAEEDKDCQIFVVEAGNIVTGGHGNFISAKVAVAKQLVQNRFPNYQIKINKAEDVKPTTVKPTTVTDAGDYLVFSFEKYRNGINYHGNRGTIVVYLTSTNDNGTDRLYDNNDNVWLVRDHNWQYTNQRCKL